ncbi:MAG TPA: MFS transporter, partial [Clostridia bacterium]|nr:MFS transporter [Clostridia bacterium]
EKPIESGFRVADVKKVVASPSLIVSSALAILALSILFGKAYTFAPLSAKALGASDMALSVISMLAMAPVVFAAPMIDPLSKRFGPWPVVLAGFLIHTLANAMMLGAPSLNVILVSQTLSGIGQGLVFPLLMGLSLSGIIQERRATAMGIYQASYGLGMFAGPYVMGLAGDSISLSASYGLATALSVAGAAYVAYVIKGKRHVIAEEG